MDRWATEQVPPDTPYPGVLRTRDASPVASLFGVTLGVASFMLMAPLVMRVLGWAYWWATGERSTFVDTYAALVAYQVPFGLVVGHLGLATLIPISAALVLFIHHVRPGYLSSVTGHLRWGWFWTAFAVAAVSLAGILVLQNLTTPGGPNWLITPQEHWIAFVAVMLLTTPLQAAAEEYFFRGYLMQAFGSMIANPWFGIVTSAAVFTLFHSSSDPALIVDRFAFGVLAGLLVQITGGLEAGIAAHVVNNVASFLLAAFTTSMAQIKAVSEVTWVAAGWDVGRFLVFFLVIVWLARRLRVQQVTAARS